MHKEVNKSKNKSKSKNKKGKRVSRIKGRKSYLKKKVLILFSIKTHII
jgi:hypothetical protein